MSDLREDLFSISTLRSDSPLYLEILHCAKTAHKRLTQRMVYDTLGQDDAIQIALQHLLSPMSQARDSTPLDHFLIHEYNRRSAAGEDFPLLEFRRLLITTIRNALLKTNHKPYVSNLVARSTRILVAPTYVKHGSGRDTSWTISSTDPAIAPHPTESELIKASNRCSHIPKVPQSSEVKDSPIYTTSNLKRVLAILFEHVEIANRQELYDFFDYLLTNWLPTGLSLTDDSISTLADLSNPSNAPDQYVGAQEFADQHARAIWHGMPENERRFLHASTWPGATQQSIADTVEFVDNRSPDRTRKYSRPNIVNFQDSLIKRLEEALAEFNADDRDDVISALKAIATFYRF